MTTGTIARWFKSPGDAVERDEAIAECESDKATFELLAPAAGVLGSILVKEGEEVPVRTVVATIVEPTDSAVPDAAPTKAPPASLMVVPAARRLAKDHGIDLARVRGTGPAGRITELDVQAALGASAAPKAEVAEAYGQVIPLRGVRGTVAERMRSSLQSMAQLTLTSDVDVTNLHRRREEAKASLPVTYTHLLIRACALALREHPRINAAVENGEIRVRPDIHIGLAVPLADGLVVPVIRNADRLSLAELRETVQGIVTEVQEGRATPDLLRGSTFTVSNLGNFGIDAFTPIINPPEVAILGVGRIRDRPAPAPSGIEWRKVMTLSLTIDHRAVDGVPGAAFLRTLAAALDQCDPLFE